jgi:hypothetical protein
MKRITGTVYNFLEYSFEACIANDSALEVCAIQGVYQVLHQYLTRPEEDEDIAEHEA